MLGNLFSVRNEAGKIIFETMDYFSIDPCDCNQQFDKSKNGTG